jgi:hypothetical protein
VQSKQQQQQQTRPNNKSAAAALTATTNQFIPYGVKREIESIPQHGTSTREV